MIRRQNVAVRERNFMPRYQLQNRSDLLHGPPNPLFNVYWSYFPQVKWLERQDDHSHRMPGVKNEWRYTFSPPTCLHGMEG